MIWRALEGAVREPLGVCATTSSGGMFNVRVSLRQRVPGEARNAIAACLGSLANIKNVFVVDPDIDIFSDQQMDWALATRFQPDRDLIVHVRHAHAAARSFAAGRPRVGAKAGFDLTWPFGSGERLEARVPEPPRFEGKRFASVAGRARGRAEILRGTDDRGGQPRRPRDRAALDAVRQSASLDRDDRGALCLIGHAQQRKTGEGDDATEDCGCSALCWPPASTVGAGAGNRRQDRHGALGVERRELIAIEKGYFKEAGIKVEIEYIDSSANMIALLAQDRCTSSRAASRPATSTRWRRTCRSPSSRTASRRRSATT